MKRNLVILKRKENQTKCGKIKNVFGLKHDVEPKQLYLQKN